MGGKDYTPRMAMTVCKECNGPVSTAAAACPKCGAPVAKRSIGLGGVVVLGVLGYVLYAVFGGLIEEAERRDVEKQQRAKEEARRPEWEYTTATDQASQKLIQQASLQSVNLVEFESPYKGPQRATLIMRRHPRHGGGALLTIERGQFNCGVSDCAIVARFDQGQPARWVVAQPSDRSSTTVFIEDWRRFEQQVQRAAELVIEAEFFRQGARTFSFDVGGVNWPPGAKPKPPAKG